LAEALNEAQQDSGNLRGPVAKIHDLFASLLSDEEVKLAIGALSRDTAQVAARPARLEMQDLESRLVDVLKSTGKYPYPPPPTEVQAVHQALKGLDKILQPTGGDRDLEIEVFDALELLRYKLRELLDSWDDDPAWASEVAGIVLPKILSAVTTLGVAIGIDEAKPQLVDSILESGIVDRMMAQTVAAVVLGAVGQRIVVAAKDAANRIAVPDTGSDKTMKRDIVEMRGSRVVQDAGRLGIRLQSPSDQAAITKSAQILLTDIRLFEHSRDGLLDQLLSGQQIEKIRNSPFSDQVSKVRVIVDDALRTPEDRSEEFFHGLVDAINPNRLEHNWKRDSKQIRGIKGK